jgi:hypothetical protein
MRVAPELHRTWTTWRGMQSRCYCKSDQGFKNYGGRGIRVCDRWRNNFAAFLEDMGRRPAGLTLDRIDNDGNYEPGNCRWTNVWMQANNRRPAHLLDQRARGVCSLCKTPGHTKRSCLIWRDVPIGRDASESTHGERNKMHRDIAN